MTVSRVDMIALGRRLLPGFLLAVVVAIAAMMLEPLIRQGLGGRYTVPATVIALLIGMAAHGLAARPLYAEGLTFCVKKLLRWAIGLLGLRIAMGDILGLGLGVALIVVVSMAATLATGLLMARLLNVDRGYGALAGAATAVCGASAALATATALPDYRQKSSDLAFTVIAANALSTIVMVLYPPLCVALGLDMQASGIMLGATIHDMAQVVGAGYAVSETAGNTAVVVKLFRVALLLPVVLAVGALFSGRHGEGVAKAKVPVPVFAIVFLALVVVNSVVPGIPALAPLYAPVKAFLVQLSNIGLLVAIAALGLGTSLSALLLIGWRHIAVFCTTTVVILALVLAGLHLLA